MEQKLSRRRLMQSGVAVTAPLLAGCANQSDDSTPTSDDSDGGSTDDDADEQSPTSQNSGSQSIHITQGNSPLYRLDPLKDPFAFGRRILNNVFDGLYEYGEGPELVPVLADGEPEVEKDGQRYIVEIVDNAEFHNGDRLTAEDVVYSFVEPLRAESLGSGDVSMIDPEGTQVIDETTVQFDLEFPYAPFRTSVLPRLIVDKQAREEDPEAYNSAPIGSGPFKYSNHVEGEFVEIEAWDDFWGEPSPNLSTARFTVTEDDASRVSQLLAGDTDMISEIPASAWERLENNDNVQIHYRDNIAYLYSAFNCNDGPTANVDVRRGIWHSYSEQAYIESQYPEAVPVVDKISPVPQPVLERWDLPVEEYRELQTVEYNPEKAAELLDGNIPDPWKPTFVSLGEDPFHEYLSARLRGLSEYGLTIEPQIQSYGIPQFNDTVFSGNAEDYQMYSIGHTGGLDPDSYFYSLFSEAQRGVPGGNGSYYGDDEFLSKIEEARRMSDQDARRQIYDELIREVLEQAAHMPRQQIGNNVATRGSVQGVNVPVHPDWMLHLTNPVNNTSVSE